MAITRKSLETLIDLVEIKLSYMNVTDKDDAKEHALLESSLHELKSIQQRMSSSESVTFKKITSRAAETSQPKTKRLK